MPVSIYTYYNLNFHKQMRNRSNYTRIFLRAKSSVDVFLFTKYREFREAQSIIFLYMRFAVIPCCNLLFQYLSIGMGMLWLHI